MLKSDVFSISRNLGVRIVYVAFMDEAGTSADEKYAVVCAAIVEPDKQRIEILEEMENLKRRYSIEEDSFIFHAKDLWHGTGFFKDKEKWALTIRTEILHGISSIPEKLRIPIAFGIVKKEDHNDDSAQHLREDDKYHALALAQCCGVIERHLIATGKDYHLVIEDKPESTKMMKETIRTLKGLNRDSPPEMGVEPIKCMIEGVMFCKKDEAPVLQIADTCAFLGRGFLSAPPKKRQFILPLWKQLEPQILEYPSNPNRIQDDEQLDPLRLRL